MYLTEETLKENPNICTYMAPSLDARQDMAGGRSPQARQGSGGQGHQGAGAAQVQDHPPHLFEFFVLTSTLI